MTQQESSRLWRALVEATQTCLCPTERRLTKTLDRIETWA